MLERLLAPLLETLRPHFGLSKTRLKTLAVLLVGLANCRTVNLSHLAGQFPGGAKHGSNYRRLQRFFQCVQLDGDVAARLIKQMLNLNRPRLLALDRTNWKLGSRDVNILVLAIVTRRFRVPLLWVLLDHAGNSATAQRIELMERYLHLFGASSIRALLADREFVGAEWMSFLNKNNVPFVIRLKEDMLIRLDDGSQRQFRALLRKPKRGTWEGWLTGMDASPDNRRRCAAKRIKAKRIKAKRIKAKRIKAKRIKAKRIKGGELLIIATNLDDAGRGLNLYRKRWGIECLFADAKTRGLNIEDTHITDPNKLSTLLVLVALAVTWAFRCATRVLGRGAIRRKGHGRREKSWFRTGLDALRNWIIHHPRNALEAWTNKCPRRQTLASK